MREVVCEEIVVEIPFWYVDCCTDCLPWSNACIDVENDIQLCYLYVVLGLGLLLTQLSTVLSIGNTTTKQVCLVSISILP